MKTKKVSRNNLNRYSSLFLWAGMVLVLFLTWRMIEYKQYVPAGEEIAFYHPEGENFDEDVVIRREKPEPQVTHPKRSLPQIIEKTDDEQQVTEDLFDDSEMLPDEPVKTEDQIETLIPDETVTIDINVVAQPPVFPGCEKFKGNREKLKKCLNKKINRFILKKFDRSLAEETGATGDVVIYVQFLVDESGKVTGIKTRSRYKEMEMEARRVIAALPVMQPGKQGNKPVKVRYTLPIRFRVQ